MAKNSFSPLAIVVIAILLVFIACLYTRKNSEGFQDVPEGDYLFVMYYSPKCGHCKKAKPHFMQLGTKQTINGKTVNIKFVNPNVEPENVLGGPKVTGYPTIRLYAPGNVYKADYESTRTREGFLQFLNQTVV
jgi:thiol-disulfide isomerase/thioredoxin